MYLMLIVVNLLHNSDDNDYDDNNDSNNNYYYLRQMNEVNGGDNVFVRCVSVCLSVFLCVRSGPVNQTSLKRNSDLTCMFLGIVRT